MFASYFCKSFSIRSFCQYIFDCPNHPWERKIVSFLGSYSAGGLSAVILLS